MLQACAINFKGSWDTHLLLIEFFYNNNYQESIQMWPFEALYGRRCRSPIYWDKIGEKQMLGLELVQIITKKIWVIHDRLQTAQGWQKSYANKGRRDSSLKLVVMNFEMYLHPKEWVDLERKGSLSHESLCRSKYLRRCERWLMV